MYFKSNSTQTHGDYNSRQDNYSSGGLGDTDLLCSGLCWLDI